MSDVIAFSGASGLAIPTGLVTALRQLDLARLRPSTREIYQLLVGALEGGDGGPELKKALGAAAWTALQDEWSLLKARAIDALPDKLAPLAAPISTLGTALDVPLFTTSTAAPVGPYFNVSGDLKFGLEVQSATAFDPPLASDKLMPDEVALRFGLDGQIGVGLSGGVTYGWGGVKAAANASGEIDLDVCYARPGTEILAASMVNAIAGGLRFSDLTALPNARARGLRRLHLNAKGKLGVSASLSAGASMLYEVPPTGVTAQPIKITGTVGAKLGFAASLAGNYDVMVDVGNAGVVTITVDRSKTTGRSVQFEVGADIGIEGLAEQASAIVDSVLPDAAPLLDAIGKYSDPIGILKERLQQEIGGLLQNGALKSEADSLALLLMGETTAAAVSKDIVGRITDRLTGSLGEEVAGALASGNAAIAQLSQQAAGRIPEWLGTALGAQIQPALEDAFKKALTSVSTELDKAISDRVGAAGNKLTSLLTPLQMVGEDVNKLQAKVKADITEAVAPIKNFIVEYQKVRGRITKALQKTATEKLALTFAGSISRTDTSEALLTCQIVQATDALRDFYRGLWLGRLDLDAVMPVEGKLPPGVASADGTFVRTLHEQRTVSATFNFFGWTASNTVTQLSDVTIAQSASGELLLLKSAADMSNVTKAFDYIKTARIGFGFEFKHDKATDTTTLTTPTLSMAYTVADEDIKLSQLMDYLQSLEDAGLLSKQGGQRAVDTLTRGDSRLDRHLKDMSLQLKLLTDRASWEAWLNRDSATLFARFSQAYFDAATSFRLPGWEFNTAMGMLAGAMQTDPLSAFREMAQFDNFFAVDQTIEKKLNRSLSGFSNDVRVGFRILRSCAVAVALVMNARESWRAYVSTALNAGTVKDATIVGTLNDLNNKLTGQLKFVVSSSMTFVGNERAVPVLTSGFVLGMLKATDREGQLVPVVLRYEENGEHELILV